jgi:predicted cobalt transporter CbtA
MNVERPGAPQRWMEANLATQGYRLGSGEAAALRIGLRFPTALCLALVVAGLALESGAIILALVPIGAIAGWTARHPFDLLWNHGLRRAFAAPELPPNPRRRRHAFKLATVWLLAVGLLLAFGQESAALILGLVLLGVCGLVTATNFCIPSNLLALVERRRPERSHPIEEGA